jgi:hypothetical protein
VEDGRVTIVEVYGVMAKTRGFQRSYVKAEDSLDSVGAIPAATRSNALSRYWSSGAICCAAHDPESLESSILVNIVKHMGKVPRLNLRE